MFSKILIANRGEIAIRIIRACKEMGISSVAVYSEADRDALHVQLADESICIGPAQAADSYLNEERIISAAIVTGAQAIHPGYGFLSENAHFAQMCRKNGLVFIGPDPECMEKVSSKTKIKEIIAGTRLKPIPGTKTLTGLAEAKIVARVLGYPVMLKAANGGGGRGIRQIDSPEQLEKEYELAVSECEAAFGDGSVYMEKYVYPARHIEVQVIADEQGHVVCLGERDCSIQRHHQKLIEESPSPAVTPEQRKALMADVADAVKVLGYVGAGTLEFLLDTSGHFWFMEMNVRIQVEHGVSEMLTRCDLVKWQIRVAAGISLDFTQDDVEIDGSSIEVRINAGSVGRIEELHAPGGPFVRFDSWMVRDMQVSPYYDALLGKLLVFSKTREESIRKMKAALCELVIEGIETNIEEQLRIVGSEEFMSGNYDTTLLEGR